MTHHVTHHVTHHSMTLRCVTAHPVTVRAEPSDKFEVHGLSDAAAREARVRVHSALSRLEGLKTRECRVRVTVSGANGSCPAADLAVAVAALDVMGVLGESAPKPLLLGEFALDGRLRPVRGLYVMLREHARAWQRTRVGQDFADPLAVVPECQVDEAAAVHEEYVSWFAARDLHQVVLWFQSQLSPVPFRPWCVQTIAADPLPLPDLSKLGAAILLVGPPGTGKLGLARAIAANLPAPSLLVGEEIVTTYSAAGLWQRDLRVPFRAPHHTVSEAGLLGGGSHVRPGEVSLAHGGCLLLDEVAEFRREALRQLALAVRDGEVCVARSDAVVRMPAKPALIIGTCEPRDFERARALYPWTGVYEVTSGEVERLTEQKEKEHA